MVRLPHPHLIALRTAATVVLSCLVAQAGWASAFLGGDIGYRAYHRVGAIVTLTACLVSAAVYVILRRSAGPVNLTLAVLVALGAVVQYALGEAMVTAQHIFLGVLLGMLGTALTSWTYRHALPTAALDDDGMRSPRAF